MHTYTYVYVPIRPTTSIGSWCSQCSQASQTCYKQTYFRQTNHLVGHGDEEFSFETGKHKHVHAQTAVR